MTEREPDVRTKDARVDRALTIYEARADQWAVDVDLPSMIANLVSVNRLSPKAPPAVREDFIRRQAEQIDAIVRQAFIEGAYREHCWHADMVLPCDVTLPPATIFRKGCKLNSLMIGLARRASEDGELIDGEKP